ncbi:hypothetical protein CA54_03510 [Symmachiella macrocystis]|uniref:Uncharacterized protein n=1 Tax=Symmachiella macrocystis TaxID=2527985 RepID=A0A5C6BM28_9PLAN|nr:hypothetical protein [Symmachiella macrocystis]TWU11544.1 hypothetical protein CA54_03510 [Symmachiella macrocystis]
MPRFLIVMLLVVTLVSCTETESTSPPEEAEVAGQDQVPDKGSWDWEAEFQEMKTALALGKEDAEKLRAAFESTGQEIETWWTNKGDELIKREAKIKQAVKERDLAGVKSATAAARPLRKEITELIKQRKQELLLVLPPESQTQWQAHQVADMFFDIAEELQLTDEQVEQVQAAALTAVESSTQETNPRAAAYLKLEKSIEQSILEGGQIAKFETIKRNNPMRSLSE